ncbi:MAG: signal recognition particle protein Srp54 [Candidatus Methanomethylicia archaeon]|jgi:signal recognition particle subunit SRP54|uniref:Signal recognition particle 54 kDa protein n=1 Tax=Thermoproteota archaeon TaxID=2056631 RepID=A0A523BB07_9CREN|nr:signal recognition particle protein Srp54 [Candidatus Methanomethylicia archaeon]MCQ5374613.1 signal recognition particle protein Srp54 [Candidatus Methanomethylicia archaeon]NHV61163.1 signal recognition particle protein [Candidatus Verstraetearchaeota archaeon]TDA38105.1 MAG: signal recognition particle protein [Candidatus Verstraetearchaeota archaeon]
MVLESLGSSISSAVKKVLRAPVVDEKVVKELVRDIQRALLQSDVNVRLVLDLSKNIEKKILEEELPPGITRRELAVKVVYDELVSLLGGERPQPPKYPKGKTTILLLVGIQGSGKTTSASKLAWLFKKQGYSVGLVCADNFRAGAYDQLKQLAEKAGVAFYGERDAKDAVELAVNGVKKLKESGTEIIIVDTAGRHKNESALIEEMRQVAEAVKPDEIILVLDATIGQQAAQQAEAFNSATKIGTILLTKLDGSARGGGALSAVVATKAPIRFIGTGEGIEEIEVFNPKRFVGRLLGMGDIESLVEKFKEAEISKTGKDTMSAIASGRFTLKDLYAQMQAMRKMGPFSKILQAIPGFGMNLPKESIDLTEEKMKKWMVIMQSMTEEELTEPHIIDGSRARRIARGSGTTTKDLKELLTQYKISKKYIKQLVKKQKRMQGLKGIFTAR